MSTFEISTCFMGKPSTLDAQTVADAVIPLLVEFQDEERWRREEPLFFLESHEVFFGTRRGHTNVRFTVRNVTLAQATKVRDAVSEATGFRWNAPTQDFDEIEKELEGQKTWGMFTAEGARAVGAMVERIEAALRAGTLSPLEEFLTNEVELSSNVLAANGYGEVFDTAVRESIYGRLDRVLEELGVVRT